MNNSRVSWRIGDFLHHLLSSCDLFTIDNLHNLALSLTETMLQFLIHFVLLLRIYFKNHIFPYTQFFRKTEANTDKERKE